MTEKDIKILERAIRSTHQLHKNIEILDFNLERFNKFEQKVSSFKITSIVVMGATGLTVGAVIGFISAQKWAI